MASVSPTPTTVLSASAPADITPTVVEGDYEADTDEEEGGDGASYQTEVVNCSCGFNEEDGLMIQVCILCLINLTSYIAKCFLSSWLFF